MRRRLAWAASGAVLWLGFLWTQYLGADLLYRLDEIDRCVRTALETRDAILLWGVGVPLCAFLVVSFVLAIRDYERQKLK